MTRLSKRLRDYQRICYETYQAVASLAEELNRFGDPKVQKLLDNLSREEVIHDDILPFTIKINLPSDKEIIQAKEALEQLKNSCPVEYYEKLKNILDYF